MSRRSVRSKDDGAPQPLTAAKVRSVARTLEGILAEIQAGESFQLTRLTRLKPLCADKAAAERFAAFLAGRALARLEAQGPQRHAPAEQWASLVALAREGVARLEQYLAGPTPELEHSLREHARAMYQAQSQQQHIPFGAARIIVCWEAMLVETAINLTLSSSPEARARYGYELAGDYVKRYRSDAHGALNRDSAEPLAEVISFWQGYADALAAAEAETKRAGRPG
jgi:hypothetical protein